MISRNERGKLVVKRLDLQIFMDDLFQGCENEREVEWVREQVESALAVSHAEALERLSKH